MSDAEILRWKDGKKAVFMLEFDDSCVTHVKNAVPELKKRSMVGTFYVNPGTGHFKSQQNAWEKEIPAAGMEYGNHTFSHNGAPNIEEIDRDIALCNNEIDKCFPGRRTPRLISFGRPGGVPWNITPEENRQVLEKYNLVERPPFQGYPFHASTRDDVLKLVDNAIANGEMGHCDFHGIGGDWLDTPIDIFIALLDKLDATKDQLWIADPVSYHKYLAEREGAELKIIHGDEKQIRLRLTCRTDSGLYDMPLTLYAKVPSIWKKCSVEQGKTRTDVKSEYGAIRCYVKPVTSEIMIKPAIGH